MPCLCVRPTSAQYRPSHGRSDAGCDHRLWTVDPLHLLIMASGPCVPSYTVNPHANPHANPLAVGHVLF